MIPYKEICPQKSCFHPQQQLFLFFPILHPELKSPHRTLSNKSCKSPTPNTHTHTHTHKHTHTRTNTHTYKQNLKVWVLRADWEKGQCNFYWYPKGKCLLCQNVEIIQKTRAVANVENYITADNDTVTETEKLTVEDTI